MPSIEFLPKMAKMFKCSIDDFFAEPPAASFGEDGLDKLKTFMSFLEYEKGSPEYKDPFEYVREEADWIPRCYAIIEKLENERHISAPMLMEKLGCDANDADRVIKNLIDGNVLAGLPDSKYYLINSEELSSLYTVIKIAKVFAEMIEGKTLEEIKTRDL